MKAKNKPTAKAPRAERLFKCQRFASCKSLPKIFNDMKIKGKQDKIDLFLKWINQRVLPIIQSSEVDGAIGIYVLSKRK